MATHPVPVIRHRDDYLTAVERLRAAAASYYGDGDGDLVLDDATYDELTRQVAAVEAVNPDWQVVASPTEVIGGTAGDVLHTVPMLSLDNVFSADELTTWADALTRRIGRPVTAFTVEPKLDGLALAARYRDGELVRLVTRGDGVAGEDVTFAARGIVGLPAQLSVPMTLEVRGEVMLTDAQFEAANELRTGHGDKPFVNPRNGAAGALRGARDRNYLIPMTFFGYQIVHVDGGTLVDDTRLDDRTHSWAMAELLPSLGINTARQHIPLPWLCPGVTEVQAYVTGLLELRPTLGFTIDGAVVKADPPADRQDAGLSSRVPRWGIAYKYPSDSAMTTLEEVLWQVGRTGVITPRARVTPVFVGGTTVTYATLHNPTDIARKDIRLHDTVLVLRAGEVIPRIEAPVVSRRTGAELVIKTPTCCPRCEGPLDTSQLRWRCIRGRACGLAELVRYAVARDAWDVEGMGDKLVAQLVGGGLVTDVADLFALTRENLLGLERTGETSVTNLLTQIEGAKARPLSRTLTALGIRGTGRSMSRRIAKHFGSMDAVCAATAVQMEAVDGIGQEKAPLVVEELAEMADIIAKLKAAGVTMVEPGTEAAGDALSSDEVAALPLRTADGRPMSVVVTGAMTGPLATLSRNQMNELIERCGGKSSGSVSKNTHLLVAGEAGSSKWNKAQSLGVPIESPDDFATRVAAFL